MLMGWPPVLFFLLLLTFTHNIFMYLISEFYFAFGDATAFSSISRMDAWMKGWMNVWMMDGRTMQNGLGCSC